MSEEAAQSNENGDQKIIELSKEEKIGGIYILGVVLLIFLIVFFASLTNVLIQAP